MRRGDRVEVAPLSDWRARPERAEVAFPARRGGPDGDLERLVGLLVDGLGAEPAQVRYLPARQAVELTLPPPHVDDARRLLAGADAPPRDAGPAGRLVLAGERGPAGVTVRAWQVGPFGELEPLGAAPLAAEASIVAGELRLALRRLDADLLEVELRRGQADPERSSWRVPAEWFGP